MATAAVPAAAATAAFLRRATDRSHRPNERQRQRHLFSVSNSSKEDFPAAVSSTSTSTSPPPRIELQFVAPTPGADRQTAAADSGEKLLRTIMNDNKIELYAPYGKVMNCGGGGTCGTCIVEIIEGQELLNPRTDTEIRYLKKKPESWRLACQTIVGDKQNAGKVVVQRLPQWKKK